MVFGLAMMWVQPYQAHLSSLDEAVKKLTLLLKSGNNWAYAFVWLNEDTQHVPLSQEGHLSAMIGGAPSRNTCRHLCQLEVHQFLQHGDQMVYPNGLNGGLEPVLTSLTASLAQGMNILGAPTHEPSFLPVDLSPGHTRGPCTWCLSSPQNPNTVFPFPSGHGMSAWKDSHISMTAEVQDLLSHAILDTSIQEFGDSTLKRPTSTALEAKREDSSKPVATFPQESLWAASPDDTMPIDHSSTTPPDLEAPSAASIPAIWPSKTSTGMTWAPSPKRYLHLQGEMNRIMG